MLFDHFPLVKEAVSLRNLSNSIQKGNRHQTKWKNKITAQEKKKCTNNKEGKMEKREKIEQIAIVVFENLLS